MGSLGRGERGKQGPQTSPSSNCGSRQQRPKTLPLDAVYPLYHCSTLSPTQSCKQRSRMQGRNPGPVS